MPIRLRRLRGADYEALVRLLQVAGMDPRTRGRDSRTAIARQLRATQNVYLGAFDGRRLVGAVLGTHDTRKGWINRLAVHPSYRRHGIARRLVREAERQLHRQGIEMFAALIEPDNRASAAVFRSLKYSVEPMLYARHKLRKDI